MINMIDNFISLEDLQKIEELCNKIGYTYGWKSNIDIEAFHWNIRFGGSGVYTETNVTIEEKDVPDLIWNIWKRINSNNDKRLIRAYVNGYTFGTEGAIHIDSPHSGNKTHMIYINTKWNPEWAGETAFFMNNEIFRSILPKPGRLIEFPGNIPHVARSVSRLSGVLRRVLVLKSMPCN